MPDANKALATPAAVDVARASAPVGEGDRKRSTRSSPARRKNPHARASKASTRIQLDDPAPSLPVKDRVARGERLHGARLDRGQRAQKYQRIKSLTERTRKHPERFGALERREATDEARRARLRGLGTVAARAIADAVLERRREQYIRIPLPEAAPDPSQTPRAAQLQATRSISIQAICTAILAAFAIPVLVAVIADVVPSAHPRLHQLHPVIALRLKPAPHGHNGPAVRAVARPATAQPRITLPAPARTPQVHASPASAPPATTNVALAPQRMLAPAPLAPLQKPALQPQPLLARTPAPSVFSAVFGESALPLPRTAVTPKIPPHTPWRLSADGHWVTTLRAPRSMHHVAFRTTAGEVLALEPSAALGERAILRLKRAASVMVTMASPDRSLTEKLSAPDQALAAFAVTAQPIGPHLISVGWTPLAAASGVAGYKVYRSDAEGGANELIAELPRQRNSWRDSTVDAGSRYRYLVMADAPDSDIHASAEGVVTPPELPAASADALAGKGMFLYFSSLGSDPHNYRRYDPDTVIGEAQKAGIRVIELRMARGTSFMAETPPARAWLNHIIDGASAAGIKLIAWTVPRRVTTEDVLQSVSAAEYQTPSGNGFVGLALDLETGARYMGDGAAAKDAMVRYIDAVRTAVGPHYLLVATVASPMMGHLTNADYPYARIAAYADVMQPMEYWHYFDESAHHAYAHGEVAGVATATVLRTRALAGRDIPVNIAGQSVDLEGTGAPSGREISWSLDAAKSVGAIGETFFDFAGTQPDGWAAIQAFEW